MHVIPSCSVQLVVATVPKRSAGRIALGTEPVSAIGRATGIGPGRRSLSDDALRGVGQTRTGGGAGEHKSVGNTGFSACSRSSNSLVILPQVGCSAALSDRRGWHRARLTAVRLCGSAGGLCCRIRNTYLCATRSHVANALADGDAYEIGDAVGGNVVPDPHGSTARDIATAGPAIVHDGALTRPRDTPLLGYLHAAARRNATWPLPCRSKAPE